MIPVLSLSPVGYMEVHIDFFEDCIRFAKQCQMPELLEQLQSKMQAIMKFGGPKFCAPRPYQRALATVCALIYGRGSLCGFGQCPWISAVCSPTTGFMYNISLLTVAEKALNKISEKKPLVCCIDKKLVKLLAVVLYLKLLICEDCG